MVFANMDDIEYQDFIWTAWGVSREFYMLMKHGLTHVNMSSSSPWLVDVRVWATSRAEPCSFVKTLTCAALLSLSLSLSLSLQTIFHSPNGTLTLSRDHSHLSVVCYTCKLCLSDTCPSPSSQSWSVSTERVPLHCHPHRRCFLTPTATFSFSCANTPFQSRTPPPPPPPPCSFPLTSTERHLLFIAVTNSLARRSSLWSRFSSCKCTQISSRSFAFSCVHLIL